MRILFIFLDGVGLGTNDPEYNPLARAEMPHLQSLLGDRKLVRESAPFTGQRLSLLALETGLGVPGLPQSATGQATLLTGINVPAQTGYHYGPKPNPEVAEFVKNGTLFSLLREKGLRVDFLNAYPPRYFEGIESGRRLYSAIPLAVVSSGMRLKSKDDLFAGQALSADFTGRGWHDHLGLPDTPVLSPEKAGAKLAELAQELDFAFFEYWLSDYAGHGQDMPGALALLEVLDGVIGGLASAWVDEAGLVLITSDHGNLEDLRTRRHTGNPVPAILLGSPPLRERFAEGLHDLSDIGRKIVELVTG